MSSDSAETSVGGRPPIPEEDLLDELERLADELGRSPTRNDMRYQGECDPNTYDNRFGSWTAAKEQVGLETYDRGSDTEYTDQELLDELERVADELGRSPTQKDIEEHARCSYWIYYDRFDSLNAAKEEVGLETYSQGDAGKKARIPTENLLLDLIAGREILGHWPNITEVNTYGEHSPPTYYRLDGVETWDDVIGLAKEYAEEIGETEVLDDE